MVKYSVPGLFKDMIIFPKSISVNTTDKYLWHKTILDNHTYDQHFSKIDLHLWGQ